MTTLIIGLLATNFMTNRLLVTTFITAIARLLIKFILN